MRCDNILNGRHVYKRFPDFNTRKRKVFARALALFEPELKLMRVRYLSVKCAGQPKSANECTLTSTAENH